MTNFRIFVVPAQAGIQEYHLHKAFWIPACAGMTVVLGLSKRHSALVPVLRQIDKTRSEERVNCISQKTWRLMGSAAQSLLDCIDNHFT
ncbi:MAG: hypothetical protein DBP01_04955 [gamma proteobacterium symbiont of Ctena orbiculata]|nr:MAG: hypothetical protein DBP01_04955 [gamma proteobacterium symbiont of Ctena orbiculata]